MNVHVRGLWNTGENKWYAAKVMAWQWQVGQWVFKIMNPLTFFEGQRQILAGMHAIGRANIELWTWNPLHTLFQTQIQWVTQSLEALQQYFISGNNNYDLKNFLQVVTEWNNETALKAAEFFKFFLWDTNIFSKRIESEVIGTQLLMYRRGKPEWDTPRPPEIISRWVPWNLLRFPHPDKNAKTVFLLAPISGHHATLLTPKVKKLMEKHTVIITDWHCASQIDAKETVGRDQYIDQIIDWYLEVWDGSIPVFATCQPCPLLLAAAALMEKYKLWKIEKMLLKAGPVDVSKNPTSVNVNAHKITRDQIDKHVMTRSPENGNMIYPGWFHLFGFIIENLEKHKDAQKKVKADFMADKIEDVLKNMWWYDEFMSYMNMTREYGLETHDYFTQNQLVKGTFMYNGKYAKNGPEAVDLRYVTSRMRIVEWEDDEICGNGQTEAAFDLCPNAVFDRVKDFMRVKGAKHYSSFSGSTYRDTIYPFEEDFINEPLKKAA
jgi:poly(3-hydroxybutyrate) depolymerase